MNTKPHRNNSDFQLRYFIAESCKTTDGAWSLLYGQRIDMEVKVANIEVQRIRREIEINKAKNVLKSWFKSKAAKQEASAILLEYAASEYTWEMNSHAACDELETIKLLMAKLEPHRKYANLPLLVATEVCQREEWCLELKNRAENFLCSQGFIPHDHLDTMRMHPDFNNEIAPHIKNLTLQLSRGKNSMDLLSETSTTPLLEILS